MTNRSLHQYLLTILDDDTLRITIHALAREVVDSDVLCLVFAYGNDARNILFEVLGTIVI